MIQELLLIYVVFYINMNTTVQSLLTFCLQIFLRYTKHYLDEKCSIIFIATLSEKLQDKLLPSPTYLKENY